MNKATLSSVKREEIFWIPKGNKWEMLYIKLTQI